MATKKEKRLEGERKAAEQREEVRLRGLKAQQADQKRRAMIAKKRKDAEQRANVKEALAKMKPEAKLTQDGIKMVGTDDRSEFTAGRYVALMSQVSDG